METSPNCRNFALCKEIVLGESNDIQRIKCKKSPENVAKSPKLLLGVFK